MKVGILTEGFQNTGYGHLTRCLSIYQAFEEKGIRPLIIANCDNDGISYLATAKIKQLDWLKEKDELFTQINGYNIVIIDSYLASLDIYNAITESVENAIFIDDYLRLDYPPGTIINGTIGAENLPYENDENHRYLLGVDYMPLRKEFWDVEPEIETGYPKNILITFGGQDIKNLTFDVLKYLVNNFNNFNYSVVLASKKQLVYNDIYNHNNVKFYSNLNASEMLGLMLNSDLAISAAGQTLYELARIGLPTIGIGVADNQKYNLHGWLKKGFIDEIIWFNESNLFERIKKQINIIKQKAPGRRNFFCDGQGARRIIISLQ